MLTHKLANTVTCQANPYDAEHMPIILFTTNTMYRYTMYRYTVYRFVSVRHNGSSPFYLLRFLFFSKLIPILLDLKNNSRGEIPNRKVKYADATKHILRIGNVTVPEHTQGHAGACLGIKQKT